MKKYFVLILILVAAVFGMVGTELRAQNPGDLDTTFGGTGIVVTDINSVSNEGKGMVIQTDGKIIVGGSGAQLTMVRYNANGSLDPSFGIGGVVTYSPTSYSESINAMALQPDGKIVVAGSNNYSPDGVFRFIVVRFNTDGTVDQAFGNNGLATVSLGSSSHFLQALVIQSDGKIVVGGDARDTGGNAAFVLARLDTSGALDPTFDGDGKVTTVFPGSTLSIISAIKIQTDNKIVAAGLAQFAATSRDFAAARYNTDGSLDSSFGIAGKMTTHFSSNDNARDVVIQPDGRIVLGGGSNNSFAFTLARYDQNGNLDASFGNMGKVVTPVGVSESEVTGIALQSDGKFVAVGTSGLFPNRDATLVRFNPNGTVDPSFGTNGIVVTPITPGSFDDPTAIKLDSSGRILITGRTDDGIGPLNHDFFVVRYLNNTFAPSVRSPFDFDGDSKTDVSIYRPSLGQWWLNRSADGLIVHTFGNSSDKITPGDFTGDGKTDVAIYRPSAGEWFVLRSEDFTFYSFPFGASEDVPVPADYDGDGKADAAVFRPSNSTWYVQRSSDNGTTIEGFGSAGDVPVPADYDGDAKTDIAIYRPSLGQWWLNRSTAGVIAVTFGNATDKPVAGDYTGDAKADIAIWRPSNGGWFILRSEDSTFYSFPFGSAGDVPVPGDYDGDGKTDAGVFRPSNATWYLNRSTAGVLIQGFGLGSDLPVPAAFVP